MSEELTIDCVIDAIASIELQRQELHRTENPEAWRASALGKLQEILHQLQQATPAHGADAERLALAQAVTAQISRVRARSGALSARMPPKGAERRPPNRAGRGAQRHQGKPQR